MTVSGTVLLTADSGEDSSTQNESDSATFDDGAEAVGGPEATSSPPTTSSPQSEVLRPTSAIASNERENVPLRCDGHMQEFDVGNLIDFDSGTGWGASSTDGTGQWAEISFGRSVTLTSVGMTPGYLRVEPRRDTGCQDVSEFSYNRFVTSVRYDFDGGESVTQSFDRVPEVQSVSVDVVTSTVTITILGTDRSPTADDDTIISEAFFEGY